MLIGVMLIKKKHVPVPNVKLAPKKPILPHEMAKKDEKQPI